MGVDGAGLISFIGMSWMTPIMWLAYKKGLNLEDLPVISPLDSCKNNVDR